MRTVETPRLLLRALTPEVYKKVFTSLSEAELREFFGCRNDAELGEERKKYEQGLSMYRKSLLIFQMIEKSSGQIIGWCGYHTWYLPHHRAEIGYMISDESKKGLGYMKEALPFVLDFGFNEMKLQRVEALIGPDNVPSLKLVHSMGFVQEGVLREHYFTNGRFEDSVIFSLLKQDFSWKPLNKREIARESNEQV